MGAAGRPGAMVMFESGEIAAVWKRPMSDACLRPSRSRKTWRSLGIERGPSGGSSLSAFCSSR